MRYDLFSLHSVLRRPQDSLWRSCQTFWMSCRNITLKPLPVPRLNIPRWDLVTFACLSSLPNPFSSHKSWRVPQGLCELMCALSLGCGEVAWALSVLRGTSGRQPRSGRRWRAVADGPKDCFSLGCLYSSILPMCSHLCLLLQWRWAMDEVKARLVCRTTQL